MSQRPIPRLTIPKFRRCIYCGKTFLDTDQGRILGKKEDICSVCKLKEGVDNIKDFINKI